MYQHAKLRLFALQDSQFLGSEGAKRLYHWLSTGGEVVHEAVQDWTREVTTHYENEGFTRAGAADEGSFQLDVDVVSRAVGAALPSPKRRRQVIVPDMRQGIRGTCFSMPSGVLDSRLDWLALTDFWSSGGDSKSGLMGDPLARREVDKLDPVPVSNLLSEIRTQHDETLMCNSYLRRHYRLACMLSDEDLTRCLVNLKHCSAIITATP